MNDTIKSAAAALGSIRSEKKAAAARANGKKGGRPNTLTGGKRGFVAAIAEAFISPASDPTIRYSHSRGFYVESGIHPAADDVLWSGLAYYNLNQNGRRSIRPVDYTEIRKAIMSNESDPDAGWEWDNATGQWVEID